VVSLKGGSHTPIDETRQSIEQTINQFIAEKGLELSVDENFLGAWVDDGWLYLDISKVYDDESKAVFVGLQNNQKAIFNLNDGSTIHL
jgi:hypothetical protein